MRTLDRNKQTLYYALYQGLTASYDENGFYAGQDVPSYAEPVEVRMNISPAKGASDLEQFGVTENYTNVLVTSDMSCPIDVNSVLWIGVDPQGPHNYVVVRVAKSLNSISYAIRQVDIS